MARRRRSAREESDPEPENRERSRGASSRRPTASTRAATLPAAPRQQPGGTRPSEIADASATTGRHGPSMRAPLLGAALIGVIILGVVIGLRPFDDEPVDDTQSETQFPNDLVPSGSRVGNQVPPSSFLTLEGKETDLSTYEGRPLVVNFWSSTCTSCLAEMPAFETVFQRYSTQDDVAFVGINIGDTNDAAKELVNTSGVTYDMGRDTARAVFPSFGGLGLPTTALVSESGKILAVRTGPVSSQELSEMITEILLA